MERYDAIIVGAGPAGLTAAIYLTRAMYRVLVLEKGTTGGQITITSEVVNYPGILKTDGKRLTDTMREQAESFGAKFMQAEAIGFDFSGDSKKVLLKDGRTLECWGVVLALGANPRQAGFVGEEAFKGRGVAYCATCDGEFFAGKEIFVVGSGLAAAEEAIFLTRYGRKVTMLVRGDKLKCPDSVKKKLENNEKITVHYHTEVVEAGGDGLLEYVVLKNNLTGQQEKYVPPEGDNLGIFVFAGYMPATSVLKGLVELDAAGYLVTDKNQKCSIDGVYGAGDVCIKNLRQVVTAVSDGAVAATELEKYLADVYERLSLERVLNTVEPGETAGKAVVSADNAAAGVFLDAQTKSQLKEVFRKLTKPVILHGVLDNRLISQEIRHFLEEFCTLSDYLTCKIDMPGDTKGESLLPEIRLETPAGYSGISFHAVPGGHEMNSFVVAIYNLGSTGQEISEDIRSRIGKITNKLELAVIATLSCTMCPELVMASQRMAALNPNIEAHMYDLQHFPELKDKYKILSVPCLVINRHKVLFGKKDIVSLLQCIEAYLAE